jgi:dihydroxyacid dehydratase/phosphogluconate dehydratase
MIKRLILAAAASVALAGASFAQDKPAEPAMDPAAEACLQQAFDLAQTAEQKKLSDTELDQLEQLLSKMEGHCDAKETAEAEKVGTEIKTMLDSKQ